MSGLCLNRIITCVQMVNNLQCTDTHGPAWDQRFTGSFFSPVKSNFFIGKLTLNILQILGWYLPDISE